MRDWVFFWGICFVCRFKKHDNNALMAEAYAQPLQRKAGQTSSSSTSDRDGALSRIFGRRFRSLVFAMNSAVSTENLTMAGAHAVGNLADKIVDLTAPNHHSEDEEAGDDEDWFMFITHHLFQSVQLVRRKQFFHQVHHSSAPKPTNPQPSRRGSKHSFEGGYPKKKKPWNYLFREINLKNYYVKMVSGQWH